MSGYPGHPPPGAGPATHCEAAAAVGAGGRLCAAASSGPWPPSAAAAGGSVAKRALPVGARSGPEAGPGTMQLWQAVGRGGAYAGFLVVRRVVGLVGLGSAPDAKDVKIAVLRHQLMVLRRYRPAAQTARAGVQQTRITDPRLPKQRGAA